MSDIQNLRIHFYGVQGSGSVFPSYSKRQEFRNRMECKLLEQVFTDFSRHVGPDGRLNVAIEELIGGTLNPKTIKAYRDRFHVPELRVYGGWTTCFRIETADGYDIVIDCGSGFRICAQDVVKQWGQRSNRYLHIFGTHSHFDHTEGFDQAAVCFDPRNHLHIYGNRQYLKALDQYLGIFSHHIDCNLKGVQTPLSYELMPAQFRSCEIRDFNLNPPTSTSDPLAGYYHDVIQPIQLGGTTIQPFEVFHPSPCLAYRFEHGGKVFVFCTDHELRRGSDPEHPLQVASQEAEERLRAFCKNADIVYRDGQFLRIEYDGHKGIGGAHGVSRLDWGHSCIEDVIEMATDCQVKHTYIGHHDPNRDWIELNWIDETLQRKSEQIGLKFEMARAETVVDL